MLLSFFKKIGIVFFILSFIVMIYMIFCRSHKHFKGLNQYNDSNFIHAFINRLYFVLTTICSIGYGDIAPHTIRAKVITILIILLMFVAILKIFDDIIDNYSKNWSSFMSKISNYNPLTMFTSQDENRKTHNNKYSYI